MSDRESQREPAGVISLQFADFAEFMREAARRQGQFERRDPAPPF
jgi:hypothetical protein